MTDKRDVKKEKKADTMEDEAKVQAEVIEDLDVPDRDEASLRGGVTTTRPACVGF